MRRRALLSSLAATTAALAGCASSTGDDVATTAPTDGTTEHPATSTDPGTTTGDGPSGEPEGYASVVDLQTGPRTYAFAPTRRHTDDDAVVALWFDRTATADHPARLTGWLENGNPYENTFDVEWVPAVGDVHGRQPDGYDHEASLHLAPTENNDLAATVPDVVRDESGYWRVEDVGAWMTETHRLAPGERVDLEFVVVGEPEMPGRPTGTYEFRGDDRDARIAVWNTDAPGVDADSRFAGRSPPALSEEASTAWFHDADEAKRAYLRPHRERAELDASVRFEMVNHSREMLRCGHWNLHKLVEGEWYHVAPMGHTADCRGLAPGDRIEWSLRAFNADAVGCDCGGGCADGLTRGYLGGGEYAVVAGYGSPEDRSAALVELVGGPVDIVPTADAEISVEDGVATVTLEEYGDGEHPPDASFAVTRAGDADERLLAEQVMATGGWVSRGRGLRNALAALDDGVDRTVVRADRHVVDAALGHDADVRRFELRGQAYEVRRIEDGET